MFFASFPVGTTASTIALHSSCPPLLYNRSFPPPLPLLGDSPLLPPLVLVLNVILRSDKNSVKSLCDYECYQDFQQVFATEKRFSPQLT